MAEPPPNVRLDLTSTPENVLLVREMLSGVAQAIDLKGSGLNDIRTAVTEACNNVVLHAYEGEPAGPMEVEVHIAEQAVGVVVRDRGKGIQPPIANAQETGPGIGLHVIRTLADRFQLEGTASGGTEARMEFHATDIVTLGRRPEESPGLSTLALAGSPATTTIGIAPIGLARTVLPRLIGALAARAHFSTDRISDTQILADALVAHAPGAIAGDRLSVDVDVETRDLELRIAPLELGHSQRLIGQSSLDGLGSVIERLTDRRRVAVAGSYETLTLGLIDRG